MRKNKTMLLVCKMIFTGIFVFELNIDSHAQRDGFSTLDSLDKTYLDWQNKDLSTDGIFGTSVNKAYTQILYNKTPKKKIIVAVIDGGVDIDHDDLKGKIWTNEKEIPGNGIDDDHNGYIDDVHGWNFLGNSKGENINYETLECVRIKRQFDSLYSHTYSASLVPPGEINNFNLYWASRKEYDKELDKYGTIKTNLEKFEKGLDSANKIIGTALGEKDFTKEELYSLKPGNKHVKWAKKRLIYLYNRGFTYKDLEDMKLEDSVQLTYNLNLNFDPRKIISDNSDDISDRHYGNSDVKGPDPFHGTFVSGIIGAIRNNNLGINGIADSVQIMVVRAIPNGDERDKDVALSIYYAVDNGARIINMSFGKSFSPGKEMVDDAIRYAQGKNVLFVQAAGNDAYDLDAVDQFPNRKISDSVTVGDWITVGASTMKMNKHLCAEFSNYGKNTVDLFAPGEDIISLTTGNKYALESGTSFAAPVVSGIAALILSYYPELTALELKNIILGSCTVNPSLRVFIPNDGSKKKKKTKFKNLSKTGGIPDTYKALIMAEQYLKTGNKK